MCGKSSKFPFCDGSHKAFNAENNVNIVPQQIKNDGTEAKAFFFCVCGHSQKRPLCDGTHRKVKVANP
jgi:CDGSH iron-sulfur domain-containing protein 3